MIKQTIGILILFLVFSFSDSKAQMTTWQMNNFKKLEKNRKKRAKTKGPLVKTKAGKQKSTKKLKIGKGKSPFSKKRYDIGYVQPLDTPKYLALRKVEYPTLEN